MSKVVNPRLCIEQTILRFNPDISDKDLLDLREEIYLKVWQDTKSAITVIPAIGGHIECYTRDYYLYSRGKLL